MRVVGCNIKPPPSQVSKIHQQIIECLKTSLAEKDVQLQDDKDGPTVVTVVNASRTKADIERDMQAANLTGLFKTLSQ